MTRNEEILAGVPDPGPHQAATFRGQPGYWCQAEPAFIDATSAGAAIAAYRQKLAEGSVAVVHNGYCDGIARLRLQARLAAAEAEVARLRRKVVVTAERWVEACQAHLRTLNDLEDVCASSRQMSETTRLLLNLPAATGPAGEGEKGGQADG